MKSYMHKHRMLRVLFLCNHAYYQHKMSRGRFLYMAALASLKDVHVDWWGIDWPMYQSQLTVEKNLRIRGQHYDVVYVYKPNEFKEFSKVNALRVIEYNEMYDVEGTVKEIIDADAQLIICHHANEIGPVKAKCPGRTFVYIPHCSDPKHFHNYNRPKTTDVLVIGRLSPRVYPLRTRVYSNILPRLVEAGFTATWFNHPGYDLKNACDNLHVNTYAKAISQARIAVFCSGTPKTRYAKYTEVPFCGTAIAADIPNDDAEFFREFVIEINMSMSDDEILGKLVHHLKYKSTLEKIAAKGTMLSAKYNVGWFAQQARNVMVEWLLSNGPIVDTYSCKHAEPSTSTDVPNVTVLPVVATASAIPDDTTLANT